MARRQRSHDHPGKRPAALRTWAVRPSGARCESVTTPEWRDQGIGSALMGEVDRYARSHDLDTLIVWPSPRSAPLYRRGGFGRSVELLELPVTPD
ncbi:GNAT family N-acetyltransferase [Nonomuraea glycinis]|nr:GNAT family N-acetyltransferase [Nonomuraea glycinis]